MHRRLRLTAWFYWIGTAVLLGRLFVLSLWPRLVVGGTFDRAWPGSIATAADLEHYDTHQINDGRGQILFRDGRPWALERGSMTGWVGQPDKWPSPTKFVPEQGRSGLEARFDAWLSGKPGYVARRVDAAGHPVSNWSFRQAARPGLSVETTLEGDWQEAARQALMNMHLEHAAIVMMDVKSHAILAAVGSNHGNLDFTEATHSTQPGSVFKLVTAAAAYESFGWRPSSKFYCDGEVVLPGLRMHCWRAHGRLTLQAAIAQSCDTTFAELGAALGPDALEREAVRLGLTGLPLQRIDGQSVVSEEERGVVFARARDRIAPQAAIGQQDVRLSPIAAANLVCTIADGGVYRDAQLVRSVVRDGRTIATFSVPGHRVMRRGTASKLQAAMRDTVESREGTLYAFHGTSMAGKTGTAELGTTKRVNAWVVGYVPANKPRVAFAVYVGRKSSGKAHAQARALTKTIVHLAESREM